MSNDIVLKVCRVCGPKDIQLFSPSHMKAKSAMCRACAAAYRRALKIGYFPPADREYQWRTFHGEGFQW
jgi:hypothetical protein